MYISGFKTNPASDNISIYQCCCVFFSVYTIDKLFTIQKSDTPVKIKWEIF